MHWYKTIFSVSLYGRLGLCRLDAILDKLFAICYNSYEFLLKIQIYCPDLLFRPTLRKYVPHLHQLCLAVHCTKRGSSNTVGVK